MEENIRGACLVDELDLRDRRARRRGEAWASADSVRELGTSSAHFGQPVLGRIEIDFG